MPVLFSFHDYWWFYGCFTAIVVILLAIDLGLFRKNKDNFGFRASLIWSAIWVLVALAFNALSYFLAGWGLSAANHPSAWPEAERLSLEFLAGYVVERSLSVDNVFVFTLVLSYFVVPDEQRRRVLFYGIAGAVLCRAIFIGFGAVLMQYQWIVYLMGVFLVLTGGKMLWGGSAGMEQSGSGFIHFLERWLPLSAKFDGSRFLTKVNGVTKATPLMASVIALAVTDVAFAIDSVPAIFALTQEPVIVFTSNLLALLGMRALYSMLSGALNKFHLLRIGLAGVLIFVGLKMVWLNELFGGEFPIWVSLAVITGLVAASLVASLIWPLVDAPGSIETPVER